MQIYPSDDHIFFVIDNVNSIEHSHVMIQISISFNDCFTLNILDNKINCKGIIIDSSTSHSFNGKNNPQLFFLVDPTSNLGYKLKHNFLKNNKYIILEEDICVNLIKTFSNYTVPFSNKTIYFDFMTRFFNKLNIKFLFLDHNNKIVNTIINEIKYSNLENFSLDNLSQKLFLSKSRLSHIFKENTGLSLYSYILMQKLQKATLYVFKGYSITESSLLNGFNSSSHFSYTVKKMLGMSFREFNKDSYFLKVSKY